MCVSLCVCVSEWYYFLMIFVFVSTMCPISTHTQFGVTQYVSVFPLLHAYTHKHVCMWYNEVVLSSIKSLASLSTGGRQIVPCVADWKTGIPKVSCAPHKQTWTTGLDVFSSTRVSSRPDKHKSETVPVRTFKLLSTIWFWNYPRGANPTRLGRTGR